MFKILFTFISIAFYILSCGHKKENARPPAPPLSIDVIIAKNEFFSYSEKASGTIIANEFVELKPEINGRIIQLNIKEGTLVKAGTLLLKLNDEDLQAQLRKAQNQYALYKKNEQRIESLLKVNGVNQQEFDNAKIQSNNVAADVDYTMAMIRKTEIRAPFTGIIGLRNVSIGASVNPQTLIATLQQVNQLKVDFVLPEDKSMLLKTGMDLFVEDSKSKSLYRATIIAIEPLVANNNRNIKARALLKEGSNKLSPGAYVNVVINVNNANSSILVPTNCVIPETRNKKVAVVKVGKVQFVNVETGYRTAEKIEIIKGIMEGDTIAISGILFLKPDGIVSIKSIKQ